MKKELNNAIKKMIGNIKGAVKKPFPDQIKPMLATLTHAYFYKSDWIYERKFDGERCIAMKNGEKVFLRSRNNLSLNASYPEINEAIEKLTGVKTVIFDGEVVAFKGYKTSFEKLQLRMHKHPEKNAPSVYYYIFDILYLDGYDLTKVTQIDRKHILEKLFFFKDPLRFSEYRFKASPAYLATACKKGWEGLMVKDIHAPYYHKRSTAWLKFKCVANQELVIGGYTDPKGSRIGFGALLLGYYKNGKLHYAGKVGTGYNTEILRDLMRRFARITTQKSPFVNYDRSLKGVHWVKPRLVAEIDFEEWTKDNKLRHSRYVGLRRDKSPRKVVQEK